MQTLDAQELANSLSSDYLNIQKYVRTQPNQMKPGIYLGSNGVHYAFRKTREGKVWPHIMTKGVEGEKATFAFDATGFKVCKAENRLTVEECEALSLYLGYCVMCGKELTVKKSVAMGMGPVCRKKY